MRLALPSPVDLEACLLSGQAHRWRKAGDGGFLGFIRNLPVEFRHYSGGLEWSGAAGLSNADVLQYLRFDGSHDRFVADVRRDAYLDRALAAFPDLRVLVQDPWEAMAAFVLSSNSNIGKIHRTIESLARLAGDPVEGPSGAAHAFPLADAVARLSETQLRSTGMGYRAPLIRAAAREVATGALDLAALREASFNDAHARLVEVPGVGPKVADCILVYGLDQFEGFPIDVWIGRLLREQYFPRKRMNYRAWGDWARSHFGPWAGYAQHYLFHYRRLRGSEPRATAVAQLARRRAPSSSSDTRDLATPLAGGKTRPL